MDSLGSSHLDRPFRISWVQELNMLALDSLIPQIILSRLTSISQCFLLIICIPLILFLFDTVLLPFLVVLGNILWFAHPICDYVIYGQPQTTVQAYIVTGGHRGDGVGLFTTEILLPGKQLQIFLFDQ